MSYSSLHNHSYYSVLDGYSSPKEYMDEAKELRLKSLAITEHGSAYSWLYFDEIKKDYPNLKLIFGVEFYETFDVNVKDKDNKYFHLLALAKNEDGRIALNHLISKSNFDDRQYYGKPRVDLGMMKPHADNLIVSSACLASKLSREENYNKCIEYVEEYKSIFKHFYLELQSHKHEDQVLYNQKLIRLSKDTNTPFIITTDSHAITKSDLKYQAKLVQIARDDDTIEEIYEGCYLQSVEEIHAIMDEQIGSDIVDIGLATTNEICNLIDVVNMPFQEPKLPHYPLPEGFDSSEKYLRSLVEKGWKKRGLDSLNLDDMTLYSERVNYELSVIDDMGFSGYFIIVWDFIDWSKKNNIMVGAGRGSAGGSLVCYLLGIVELNPMKYDLIFERFLNPERISMPDIDLDFGDRDAVINYLIEKYGENNVCQIINYSYITPLTAIKDTARAMGIPYSISEQISKRFDRGVYNTTFDELFDKNKDLLDKYPDYKELFDTASKMSGRLKNVSTHAGGVGIVDTDVNDYMPMKLGNKGEHVVQADKKKSEDIGIIKFDILGISTISMMQEILSDANIDEWEINPNNDNFLTNEPMWDLIKSAKTNAVFQVESQGMKDLLVKLQPSSLDEVSAILALYRPDSMDMLEDYTLYKNNPKSIKLWHPDMGEFLEETYGCIIYQEQLMNIVRKFGGRSMGGADKFRKAIGKKDIDLVKKESKALLDEIINNGYGEDIAETISLYLESKGGYMFNKSHSMLYSVITLQTAYLKANYTKYFFKALFNQKKDDYGILTKYIVDAMDFGVEISPPDINKSDNNFSVSDNKILFGFDGIKGVGQKLSERILEERTSKNFKNFKDFYERVSPTVSQMIALIKSGAIKCKNKRSYLLKYANYRFNHKDYKPVKTVPSKKILKEKWGLSFKDDLTKENKLKKYNLIRERDFDSKQVQKLKKHMDTFRDKYLSSEGLWEFNTLSVFINDNPFEEAKKYVSSYRDAMDEDKCVIVGVISNIAKRTDRHKKQFAFISLYTYFGEIIDITTWNTQYKKYQDMIKKGNKIAVLCKKQDGNRYVVEKMKDYDIWLSQKKNK